MPGGRVMMWLAAPGRAEAWSSDALVKNRESEIREGERTKGVLERISSRVRLAFGSPRPARLRAVLAIGFGTGIAHGNGRGRRLPGRVGERGPNPAPTG
jgi:hypothetical protein